MAILDEVGYSSSFFIFIFIVLVSSFRGARVPRVNVVERVQRRSENKKKQQAEEQGLLTPHSGDTIYEGTVGSTGISLAAVGRARGYPVHMYVESFHFEIFSEQQT